MCVHEVTAYITMLMQDMSMLWELQAQPVSKNPIALQKKARTLQCMHRPSEKMGQVCLSEACFMHDLWIAPVLCVIN